MVISGFLSFLFYILFDRISACCYKLVCNCKLCIMIEYMDLFWIQSKCYMVAKACGCRRFYFCAHICAAYLEVKDYF